MNIKIFNNNKFGSVRMVNIDGEPWFVAKDVLNILALANGRSSLSLLDDDERGVHSMDTLGGYQELAIVSESGLYSLILKSRKPEAKQFKRWITHEVLPSIRKHGLYAKDELLNNPDLFISALKQLKAERERTKRLELENAQSKQIIGELSPKASYYDLILQNKSVVSITNIAKDYGMSARAFNKMLHEIGVQFKQGKTWFLYQQYATQGYTQSKTHVIDAKRSVMHTYWTQKGRLFLYDLLKKSILPVIERNQCA